MRRRFACEYTNTKLRVRIIDADDARAAVLMHIENADRQDITAMERAMSFLVQAEAKVFPTQDAMAEALGVSKGQVAKMIKAAQLLKQTAISQLFADKSTVPVEQAYKSGSVPALRAASARVQRRYGRPRGGNSKPPRQGHPGVSQGLARRGSRGGLERVRADPEGPGLSVVSCRNQSN